MGAASLVSRTGASMSQQFPVTDHFCDHRFPLCYLTAMPTLHKDIQRE